MLKGEWGEWWVRILLQFLITDLFSFCFYHLLSMITALFGLYFLLHNSGWFGAKMWMAWGCVVLFRYHQNFRSLFLF